MSVISTKDFNKICLICLSRNGRVDIFKNASFMDIYTLLTEQKVKTADKMPQQICDLCVKNLKYINNFVKMCKASYNLLNEIALRENEDLGAFDGTSKHQYINEETPFIFVDVCKKKNTKELLKAKRECEDNGENNISYDLASAEQNCHQIKHRERKFTSKKEYFQCHRSYTAEKSLQLHLLCYDKHPFKCTQCRWSGGSEEDFQRHQVNHQDFYTSKALPVEGSDKWQCMECGKQFTRKFDVLLHLRIHAGFKPYACMSCEKRFTQKVTLQRHILSRHTEEKDRFECYICERTFYRKDNFDTHMRKMHIKRQADYVDIPIDDEDDDEMPVRRVIEKASGPLVTQCTFCGKSFSLPNYLRQHEETVHSVPKRRSTSPEKSSAQSKSRDNTCVNLCAQCGRSFINRKTYYTHKARHHPTTEKQILNRQKKGAVAAGNKSQKPLREFQCWHCGKIFHNSCNLLVHVRTHTGDKPYACSFCQQRFAAWNSWKDHENIHTGATPFRCDQCLKAFKQRSALRKHKQSHQW